MRKYLLPAGSFLGLFATQAWADVTTFQLEDTLLTIAGSVSFKLFGLLTVLMAIVSIIIRQNVLGGLPLIFGGIFIIFLDTFLEGIVIDSSPSTPVTVDAPPTEVVLSQAVTANDPSTQLMNVILAVIVLVCLCGIFYLRKKQQERRTVYWSDLLGELEERESQSTETAAPVPPSLPETVPIDPEPVKRPKRDVRKVIID